MIWKQLGEGLDTRIGDVSERATRKMTRRVALRTVVVGGVSGLGALALGQRPAFAAPRCSQGVDCGRTPSCNYQTFCGGGDSGCPSGYHLCKLSGSCGTNKTRNEQGYWCEWNSGYWVACTGCGSGGAGSRLCLDCVGPGGCAEWCTCVSPCTA
jgi:hypothetical protein